MKRFKDDPSQPVKGQVPITDATSQYVNRWKKKLADFYLSQEHSTDAWPPLKLVHFVQLSLVKQEEYATNIRLRTIQKTVDEVYGQKININFRDIFKKVEHGSLILFEGRPGSGKTTLMVKISCDWARKEILCSKIMLFIRLRHLPKSRDIYLHDLVRNACGSFTPEDVNDLSSYIEGRLGEDVVFVLDGFDEYAPGASIDNYVSKLISKQVNSRSTTIVSSRPAATQHFRQDATMWVEVVGFLKEQVIQYIRCYFEKSKERSDKLIEHLELHPNLMNLCYLPLHCAMLVFFFTLDTPLPTTETEFYKDFTLSLLTRGVRKQEDSHTRPRVGVLESFDYLPNKTKVVFNEICKLAFEATIASQQVFEKSKIQSICSLVNSEDNLGLVVTDRYFVRTGVDESFTFLHLTLQEYLAAVYIAGLDETEQVSIVTARYKRLSVTLLFLFGILDHSNESTKNLFKLMLECTCNDLMFHFRCAYESQHSITCACSDILKFHQHNLKFVNTIPSDLFYISFVLKTADFDSISLCFENCNFSKDEAFSLLQAVRDRQLSLTIKYVVSLIVVHYLHNGSTTEKVVLCSPCLMLSILSQLLV